MRVDEVSLDSLQEYATIPMTIEVRSIYRVELIENGLGGMRFVEQSAAPYIKDYDDYGSPLMWGQEFDLRNWGLLLAQDDQSRAVGGAAVAWNTNGVHMLEGRSDLAVLWDIRVHPKMRRSGIGSALFRASADWARARGCRQLKIETQNVNTPACRFYASRGCRLGDIRRFAYRHDPRVAEEVQLNWYLDL